MATAQEISDFKDLINKCLSLEISNLTTKPEWGSINFEDSVSDFKRIEALLNSFLTLPLEYLPDGVIPPFSTALTPVESILSSISKFDIAEGGDPTARKVTLVNQLRDAVNNFFRIVHIYIPYLAYQRGDVDNNIAQLTGSVRSAEKFVEDAKLKIDAHLVDFSKIISSAREASAKAGVGVFTKDFSEESEKQATEASAWLKRTAWLAISTLSVAFILSAVGIFSDFTKERPIQFVSSKVLIILILVTATLWCGKMYKAAKHLAAMNKHRANGLLTFQAFVQATGDEATKNAVLLETTRSIFAITPSGLLDGQDTGSSDGSLKVLEVIKQMGSHKP